MAGGKFVANGMAKYDVSIELTGSLSTTQLVT